MKAKTQENDMIMFHLLQYPEPKTAYRLSRDLRISFGIIYRQCQYLKAKGLLDMTIEFNKYHTHSRNLWSLSDAGKRYMSDTK